MPGPTFDHGTRLSGLVDPASPINWAHPLNRSLVADWSVTANSGMIGGTVLHDLVRGGRRSQDGTLTNGPTWAGRKGRPGGYGSLLLGTTIGTQYVDVGWIPVLPFSVAAWVYVTDLATEGNIIWSMADSASAVDRYFLGVDVSTLNKFTANVTSTAATAFGSNGAYSAASAVVGRWYHVVGVWATASFRSLYVNGLADGSKTFTVNPSASNRSWIGRFADSTPNWPLRGFVDGVQGYNRALSNVEVANIYKESLAGNPDRWNWIPQGTIQAVATSPPPSFSPWLASAAARSGILGSGLGRA